MKIVIPVFLAVLLGAAGYMLYEQHTTEQRFKDINAEVNLRRKLDSVRTIIETKFIDSLSSELSERDSRISLLESEIHKTKQQNAELEKRFNAVRVFMPEF